MSGRKASEVNALLKNGKRTRSGSIDMLNSSYEEAVNAVQYFEECFDTAKSVLAKVNIKMDVAEDEFPVAAKEIRDSVEKIKKKIATKKKDALEYNYKQEYDSLMESFQKIDRDASAVAASVKNKPHYCDEEYRRASKIARDYDGLRMRVYQMNNRYQSESSSLNAGAVELRRLQSQLKSLTEEAKNLEKKAKNVKTLRENAGKAKSSIEGDFNSIEEKIAKKFFSKEYENLKDQVSLFMKLSDTQVMKSVTSMTMDVKSFSLKLAETYEDFLRKQSITKSALDAMKERVSRKILKDPFDEFKAGDTRELSLIEFLDEHCQGKHTSDIQAAIHEAEFLFNKEQFAKADKVLANLTTVVDEASNLAALTHEHRKQTVVNALAIRKTMIDLQYDVSAKMERDADGNFAGYTVTCTAGDEKIVLDNINVDENGKLGFGIDHTESVMGTCHKSWKKIRECMVENGVLLEDVTKNGHSVIYEGRVAAKKTTNAPTTLKMN